MDRPDLYTILDFISLLLWVRNYNFVWPTFVCFNDHIKLFVSNRSLPLLQSLSPSFPLGISQSLLHCLRLFLSFSSSLPHSILLFFLSLSPSLTHSLLLSFSPSLLLLFSPLTLSFSSSHAWFLSRDGKFSVVRRSHQFFLSLFLTSLSLSLSFSPSPLSLSLSLSREEFFRHKTRSSPHVHVRIGGRRRKFIPPPLLSLSCGTSISVSCSSSSLFLSLSLSGARNSSPVMEYFHLREDLSPLPLFHDLYSSLSLSLSIFSPLHLLLFSPSFAKEDLFLFHLFHLLLVSW